jgi:hypothetical protein
VSALELSRRRLLALVGGAALAWQGRPFGLRPPAVDAQVLPGDPLIVPTLEAFADTIIPGEKRSPADRSRLPVRRSKRWAPPAISMTCRERKHY